MAANYGFDSNISALPVANDIFPFAVQVGLLAGSGFSALKSPLSQATTKPSVALFNSSQRARICSASGAVILLSAAA